MDLKESTRGEVRRHPWETARLKALQGILPSRLFEGMKILDVGCGDGFISRGLFNGLQQKEITAVDINLSDEWIAELNGRSRGIIFRKEMPPEGGFDLILLLDVMEHVPDDGTFLGELATRYLRSSGAVMITVPAFQSIFSGHDVFLGHYRRYSLDQLTQVVAGCGLQIVGCGYLFFSLLLPKFLLFKVLATADSSKGVGNWGGGAVITFLLEKLLHLDNRLLMAAGRVGMKVPGLTAWALCEKRG